MSVVHNRPSPGDTNANNISALEVVADEVYLLIDEVDSESIAEEFRIGIHNPKHDLESHVRVVVPEGLDPSSSLAELEDKTVVDDSLKHMPESRFSELTNDGDYRAIFASCSSYSTRHSCLISVQSSETAGVADTRCRRC